MSTLDSQTHFDVIVIGGGHAGTEAALAAARSGARTLLLTQNIDTLGLMSCNPAVGGIGKGHLVKEIDAMGGAMGLAIDQASIQFRTLNASKGPAVRATRAQADRALYKHAIRNILESQPGLYLFQQNVEDLFIENNKICGVLTQMGLAFYAPAVVLTVGTFLGGRIFIGQNNYQGGRAGDAPANALAQKLRALPFRVGRLKTGTPPRIDKRSICFAELEEQPADADCLPFSFWQNADYIPPQQVCCHITYTNANTHDIIRQALPESPLYSGEIEGIGPRYCPSIEDKIVRFDREKHQIFIEPEGLNSAEVYPNGISTSLPFNAQLALVRSIKGLEQAHITRPGYAIEYDFFDPRDLQTSLQTNFIEGLFFAGQINGTTGYEEAAAQGLVAGINAARAAQNKSFWQPRRDECYIGVLIDDLTTQGTLEPYRMFTSRAEYRLYLREDNADQRLTPMGFELGVVPQAKWQCFQQKMQQVKAEQERVEKLLIRPETEIGAELGKLLGNPLRKEFHLAELLRRPELSYSKLRTIPNVVLPDLQQVVAEQVEIAYKYKGYLKRQQEEIERNRGLENMLIPANFNYAQVSGLSNEVKEKLNKTRPETVGQAGRIPGITPAAVSILIVYLRRTHLR